MNLNLDNYLNSDNIPVFSEEIWNELNSKIPKDIFKKSLARYIIDNKIPFPYKNISYVEMRRNFKNFCMDNLKPYFLDRLEYDVLERTEKSKYPYKKYGLGIIQLGHQYNKSSNYFHQKARYKCSGYSIDSCVNRWNTGKDLENLLSPLWRMNNKKCLIGDYHGAFRLGGYVATQFKPHVAKIIFSYFNAVRILDTSCGWGDRLAGFYATEKTKEYYGCDPNKEVYDIYKEQCKEYEYILTGKNPIINDYGTYFESIGSKKVVIQNCAAEDMHWNKIPEVDHVFTSPPYFCTERYAEGQKEEINQSWFRYKDYRTWFNNFLLPVSKLSFEKLCSDGIMAINIMNPKINKEEFNASEDLVDSFKDNFIGQIGMRIKQRPRNIDKKDSDALFKKLYVEPIWCFKK